MNWSKQQAAQFKKVYGRNPAGFKPISTTNYADSLKNEINKADFNIITGKGTAQDSVKSKYAGVLSKKNAKSKTPKQQLDNEIATIERKILNGTITNAELERLRKLRSSRRRPKIGTGQTKKKLKSENYGKKIENLLFKKQKIEEALKKKPIEYETGPPDSTKVLSGGLKKLFIEQNNAYADSLSALRTRQFFDKEAKRLKIPSNELTKKVATAEQLVRKIYNEELPGLPYNPNTPQGKQAIKEYINQQLIKQTGMDYEDLKYFKSLGK